MYSLLETAKIDAAKNDLATTSLQRECLLGLPLLPSHRMF